MQTERQRQNWLENVPHLACQLDAHGAIRRANKRLCQRLERTPEDLWQTSFVEACVAPEAAEAVSQQLSLRLQTDILQQSWRADAFLNIPLRKADGASTPTLWSIEPYAWKDASEGFLALGWDESQQHELEHFLHQLANVAELTRESLVLTDAHGIILFVNTAFSQISGYGPGEVVGRSPSAFIQPPENADEMHHALSAFQRGDHWDGRIRLLAKNGAPLSLSTRIIPLQDRRRAITHYLALATDISETQHLQQQVEILQRMESVSTLAGGIAHRFNNVLASIAGHAELMRMLMPDNPQIDKHTGKILAATEKGRVVVEQLSAYSRREAGRKRPVDLVPVVRSALQFFDSVKSRSIRVEMDLPESLPEVLADTDKVHQVLLNLFTNADEAIGDAGGILHVSMRKGRFHSAREKRERQGVLIDVADSGPGIPKESLKRIFEPFYTTKGMAESSGMGLFVVHGIMQQHEGLIQVTRTPEYKTVMRLAFPVIKTPAMDTAPPIPLDDVERKGLILLVEPDPHLRATGATQLQSHGFSVIPCDSPRDAMLQLEDDSKAVALALTALSFDGEQCGYDLAAFIQDMDMPFPVILTPLLDETVDWTLVSRHNIAKVLPKPMPTDDLLEAIERYRVTPPETPQTTSPA